MKSLNNRKSISVIGSVLVVLLLSAFFVLPQKTKHVDAQISKVDKKPVPAWLRENVVKKAKLKPVVKVSKKISKAKKAKRVAFKKVQKKLVKSSIAEQAKRLMAIKKQKKFKPRMVAQLSSIKMRPAGELSHDHWNLQHEQVETLTERVSEDPVGAAAFENKRLKDELSAAGL